MVNVWLATRSNLEDVIRILAKKIDRYTIITNLNIIECSYLPLDLQCLYSVFLFAYYFGFAVFPVAQ